MNGINAFGCGHFFVCIISGAVNLIYKYGSADVLDDIGAFFHPRHRIVTPIRD
jgi:hypothetical protein